MLLGIDTGTSQDALDWAAVRAAGVRFCYVKLGGDNVDTYVAPHYVAQVEASRAGGFITGHYWVPDGNYADPDDVDTPEQQADFFVGRLHGWTIRDFVVLDNEGLDGASRFSDAQAAAWIERVKARLHIPGRQVKHYSGWHDAAGTHWPLVLSTGAQFVIADYRDGSQPPFSFPDIPTVPRERIDGHQYTSSGVIGEVTLDLNVFRPAAFTYRHTSEGDEMLIRSENRGDYIASPGILKHSDNPSVFNILEAEHPDMQIVHVRDSDVVAFVSAYSGIDAAEFGSLPKGGLWVNPALRAPIATVSGATPDQIAAAIARLLPDSSDILEVFRAQWAK